MALRPIYEMSASLGMDGAEDEVRHLQKDQDTGSAYQPTGVKSIFLFLITLTTSPLAAELTRLRARWPPRPISLFEPTAVRTHAATRFGD
jgi:hypothetical protein